MSRKRPFKKRLRPQKPGSAYRQVWRVVDGAVSATFAAHPDYLSERGADHRNAQQSLVKRVVGAIISYAAQIQVAQSRSGDAPAADRGSALHRDASSGREALRGPVGDAPHVAHSLILGWLA